jgi:hypothetical protein
MDNLSDQRASEPFVEEGNNLYDDVEEVATGEEAVSYVGDETRDDELHVDVDNVQGEEEEANEDEFLMSYADLFDSRRFALGSAHGAIATSLDVLSGDAVKIG